MAFSVALTQTDATAQTAAASFVFGDPLPDAPELAARGPYGVGVRTLALVNPDQLEVLAVTPQDPEPRYDRPLTVELFYPGDAPAGALTTYEDVFGHSADPERPNRPLTFLGRAERDAEPDASGAPYPLVILSHGYPGSRLMMTYLAENLASKGYVVAAVAHTDSTFDDVGAFASTLLNRPLDQLFVLDELARRGAGEGFLGGLVDAERVALIGYSMGGYGALNAAGAGFSEAAVAAPFVPNRALALRQTGAFEPDPRIKAVVAFAPWGGPAALEAVGVSGLSFWDEAGLAGLRVPTLFVAGDQDDVSGFEGGVKALFEGAVNAERYLLVYQNARHNVAPNPPPLGAPFTEYARYAEFAWDARRINNINQHFVTAFLAKVLKGEPTGRYLELVERSNEGVWAQREDGSFAPEHSYWAGFENRTAVGLEFYHRPARGRE
ncbi:alpha/beta hydrolase family protein [Truepera radiovictrix]|nr:dienelactone hydrolase [Truepera radiovictrix]WMT58621.1 dienelactone hydrolase [Truepera radiovictrix]